MTKTNPKSSTPNNQPILPSWRIVVRNALKSCGGQASLAELYARVEGHPRTALNPHWKDKIRQVVQRDPLVERVERGVWRLKSEQL